MATPADQRLLEVLEKWLKSLELHIRYSSLDADSYSKIQPWPEHQRPSRWIIDLAMQKAVALRAQIQERIKMGDAKFSDSLELMTFLANLIGSEHIERFIPLADPAERDAFCRPLRPTLKRRAAAGSRDGDTRNARVRCEQAPPRAGRNLARRPHRAQAARCKTGAANRGQTTCQAHGAGEERAAIQARLAAGQAASPPAKAAPPPAKPAAPPARSAPARPVGNLRAVPAADAADGAREQVIADAARLVQWGRKWYELAELIARMADRPSLAEVRRILKDNKTAIEKKAGRS